jgi:hypothetical protein
MDTKPPADMMQWRAIMNLPMSVKRLITKIKKYVESME